MNEDQNRIREKIFKVLRGIKSESESIKPYVVVAQPRRCEDELPAQNLRGYEGLHIDMLGYSHGFVDIYGEKVDVARNYLIEQVLESGAKYLLFVGEDTVLPYDGFLKLHEVAEKNPDAMVVGVYYIKLSSPMIMIRKDDHIVPADVTPGQVYEAWQTGLDAALIPVSILQKLKDEDPELPFCCIAHGIPDIPFIGEDNFFVYRLRQAGFRLLVNTDVQCLHMDLPSGKYTAYPKVDLKKYYTNIPITGELTMEDKEKIDKRWIETLPKNFKHTPIKNLPKLYSDETYKTIITEMDACNTSQNYYELCCMCQFLKELKPKTILEIGVEDVGTMRVWSKFADPDALYIGIDTDREKLEAINYSNANQKFIFINSDSNEEETLNKVKNILGDTKVDFLFIDGNHSRKYAERDYNLYSPLVRDLGIIAFHDIAPSITTHKFEGLMTFWNELKEANKINMEFINTEDPIHFGIGAIIKG